MPLHTTLKQPVATLWYTELGGLFMSLFIVLISSILLAGGGTCTGSGCAYLTSTVIIPAVVLIVLIIMAYPFLYWKLFSYELAERSITVNSGVIFRQYEAIDFARMQTIDLERGPLLMLFGLTEVQVWTASSDQISFSVGTNSTQAHPHPDAKLILQKDDAVKLRDFMMNNKVGAGV